MVNDCPHLRGTGEARSALTRSMNILGGIASLFESEEDDDPSCLKNPILEQIWAGPELSLQLTRNANPWDFRDKIRMNSLALLAKVRRAVRAAASDVAVNSHRRPWRSPLVGSPTRKRRSRRSR